LSALFSLSASFSIFWTYSCVNLPTASDFSSDHFLSVQVLTILSRSFALVSSNHWISHIEAEFLFILSIAFDTFSDHPSSGLNIQSTMLCVAALDSLFGLSINFFFAEFSIASLKLQIEDTLTQPIGIAVAIQVIVFVTDSAIHFVILVALIAANTSVHTSHKPNPFMINRANMSAYTHPQGYLSPTS